jgi:hypothetical protein
MLVELSEFASHVKKGHRLRVVDNMVVRQKFELKWDEVTGDWRK